MRRVEQGSFITNQRNEFQPLDKNGRPSSLMMLRIADKGSKLPAVLSQEASQESWDRAWADYLNDGVPPETRSEIVLSSIGHHRVLRPYGSS